jgi:hypothetical protein
MAKISAVERMRRAEQSRSKNVERLDSMIKSSVTAPVTIAYVHGADVSHSWHSSLMALVSQDMVSGGSVLRGGWIGVRCGTDGLAEARNKAVRGFLDVTKDTEDCWLLWLDTDMGFGPDLLARLVDAADSVERPIVGALCFAWKEVQPDGMGGYRCMPRPVIMDWVKDGEDSGFMGRQSYQPNTLTQCGGTGSAAILIHRSVFQKIYDSEKRDTWYTKIPNPTSFGSYIGEDLSFCARAGSVGIPVFVHTGIHTSHHKNTWISEPDFFAYTVAGKIIDDRLSGEDSDE